MVRVWSTGRTKSQATGGVGRTVMYKAIGKKRKSIGMKRPIEAAISRQLNEEAISRPKKRKSIGMKRPIEKAISRQLNEERQLNERQAIRRRIYNAIGRRKPTRPKRKKVPRKRKPRKRTKPLCPLCDATTKAGRPCRNRVCPPRAQCWPHSFDRALRVQERRDIKARDDAIFDELF